MPETVAVTPIALTRQIHFDQCLFGRALAPPIALDDRGLEGLLPEARYPQRLSLALVCSLCSKCPARLSRRASLRFIALRIAQPIGLGIFRRVQRLLDADPNYPVEVVLIIRQKAISRSFSSNR